ncbi:hypothetical protein ATZ36_00215 [Candidatus Endomicrobiellum trichonymphae]|uniref:Uncharacterized protein n=1 Tax=Endomicrobium trichonymphae TaxID=1408204 RepID=A0A1E5IH63_ENDTX|nr:hypothetical protein ATZ36_00215 [Candidatus Endomicrobium trichonymphae]
MPLRVDKRGELISLCQNRVKMCIRHSQFGLVKILFPLLVFLSIEAKGVTISQVMGCGKQKDYKKFVYGTEIAITMLPKIKIENYIFFRRMGSRKR